MRDYQKECIVSIEDTFRNQNRQMVNLPTGSGKTWIFCDYISRNSKKFLIICPTIELKEQIHSTCKSFNINDISYNINNSEKSHIITFHILSEKNLSILKQNNYDHIIVDEAHHSQAPTYKRFFDILDDNVKIIGFTATPERLDGRCLLDIFDTISYEKNIIDLVNEGYLSDIEAYKIKTHQKISKRAADFRNIELKLLDNDQRNKIIIDTYMKNCVSKKTLIFCLNINHSIKISEILKSLCIKSAYIHGRMNKNERQNILEKFKNGELNVITNCQLLTEGFDEPSIEALMICRPTASKSLYCQMVGRGIRKTEKKDLCYLYELADNNHNICNFNTLSEGNLDINQDYTQGLRLKNLIRDVEKIKPDEIKITIEKLNLFSKSEILSGNSIDILKSDFYKMKPNENQLLMIKKLQINHHHDINFLEAAFLLWKRELEVKYGIYKAS